MGLDIGPATAERYAREIARAGHGLLERPDGRVRDRAVRGRHARGGRGGRARPGADGRRGRRLGRGAAQFGLEGDGRPPLDGRRRDARAGRGQRRCRGCRRSTAPGWRSDERRPHAAGRGQLEDAQDAGAGGGVHPGAAAARVGARRRRRRDLRALHRPAARWSTARAARASRSTRRTCTTSRGRLHGRGLGADARASSTCAGWCSATPSGARCSARPTGRSR